MGDVFVVTHTRATARWAAVVASVVGPQGTELSLKPVVILLTRDVAKWLLATGRPELAVFATWAVHHQKDPQAVKVVERALLTVNRARVGALRDAATPRSARSSTCSTAGSERRRGFSVSAATRKRVLACDDKRSLDRWIDRAATATTLRAVFGTTATRTKRKTTAG
ncbi:MAG: hypothetical protein U0324_44950 [Polyangiales bacterium]